MNPPYGQSVHIIRLAAALIAVLSGLGQIGALWLRDLSGAAVGDALLGAVYLMIAIGLFGRSRLSLFLAIAVSAAASLSTAYRMTYPADIDLLRITLDLGIMLFSALELWRTRHHTTP